MYFWVWPWALGHGPWALGPGPWAMGPGPWAMGHGPWAMGHGPWAMGPGPWALGQPGGSHNLAATAWLVGWAARLVGKGDRPNLGMLVFH